MTRPDVLIGQAYFLRFDPKLWAARQPYAPLGSLYAAACARAAGYEVAFFDAMLAQSEGEWTQALDRCAPRLAVLFEDNFNYLTKMCLLRMRQAAMTMIGAARDRGIPIVVAGSDASDHPEMYLDAGADVVIIGEGEQTLVALLDVFSGRTAGVLTDIPGVCLRDVNGRLVRTAARPTIADLDALPRPAWDLVDVDRYRQIWQSAHGRFSMNVATTRGCPYHCNWCAKPIWGQRYGARSPASVAAEIAWLQATYQPDHLWIADDIFGLKPGWIEQFAALRRDGVRVPYKALLRADGVSDAVADALAASGCETAWIGAESGSQRILDAMEKGIRIDHIAEATRRLRARGIAVGFFLQFGYPGETLDDIQRTRQMIYTCRPDDIGISVAYPLPGTTFYERVQAQLGVKRNWVDSDDLVPMYVSTYRPEFYRALHTLVHREFRVRRGGALLRAALGSPGTVTRRGLREIAGVAWHWWHLPGDRRRVERLAVPAEPQLPPPPTIVPILSRNAAALPRENGR